MTHTNYRIFLQSTYILESGFRIRYIFTCRFGSGVVKTKDI